MASIFVDEGLDKIISIFPKNGTNLSSMYIGLFTSQTASTVPARTATGGAAPSGWTEMTASSGTYARISIAAASWGSISTDGSGRKFSAAQVSFTNFVSAANANGFFIATLASSQAGDTLIHFANFDSGIARALATISDILKVTPAMKFNGT